MKSVFLSHSSKDKNFVRVLAGDLRQAGIQVWLDEAELLVGDSLVQKIGDALQQVDFVAVILSSASVASEWVRREVEVAVNLEITEKRISVLPILKEPCDIPTFLKGKIYADFSRPEFYDVALRRLLARLGLASSQDHVSIAPAYHALRSFLSQSNFRAADAETRRLICESAGMPRGLSGHAFDKVPCILLRTVDELWLRYSHGRFGFSAQRAMVVAFRNAEEFASALGWRRDGVWLRSDDVLFHIEAPEGHLPVAAPHGLMSYDASMGASGWLYSVKEYAKTELVDVFSSGGLRRFIRRVITDSEPVALAHQWLVANAMLYSRLAQCEKENAA